ncbi:MAG: HigA family addiction module antidote protein [Spirochaetes bacterium]|nr:HigA family addiction module antidote protein [Spirochaetota bacterium]
MNKMKRKPVHPGKIIQEDYLKPLAITITEMASILGVSRKTLSKITNEKGAITPDMSLRLARAFDTTPELWMNLQKNYDLWQAEHISKDWQRVKPIPVHQLHANI